jgi:hypothetical protein
MEYLRTEPGKSPAGIIEMMHWYNFKCEGCGSEGELGVPVGMSGSQFRCPDECGASYIQWDRLGTPDLMCVVRPIFEDEARKEFGL